jgi:hypothetical protein
VADTKKTVVTYETGKGGKAKTAVDERQLVTLQLAGRVVEVHDRAGR